MPVPNVNRQGGEWAKPSDQAAIWETVNLPSRIAPLVAATSCGLLGDNVDISGLHKRQHNTHCKSDHTANDSQPETCHHAVEKRLEIFAGPPDFIESEFKHSPVPYRICPRKALVRSCCGLSKNLSGVFSSTI